MMKVLTAIFLFYCLAFADSVVAQDINDESIAIDIDTIWSMSIPKSWDAKPTDKTFINIQPKHAYSTDDGLSVHIYDIPSSDLERITGQTYDQKTIFTQFGISPSQQLTINQIPVGFQQVSGASSDEYSFQIIYTGDSNILLIEIAGIWTGQPVQVSVNVSDQTINLPRPIAEIITLVSSVRLYGDEINPNTSLELLKIMQSYAEAVQFLSNNSIVNIESSSNQSNEVLEQIYISQSLEIAVNYPANWIAKELNGIESFGFLLSSGNAQGEKPVGSESWLSIKDYQNFDGDSTREARQRASLHANDDEFVPGRNAVSVEGFEVQIGNRTIYYMEFHEPESEQASGLWLAMPYNQDRYLVATLSTGSPETYQAIRNLALEIVASARDATNEELLAVSDRDIINDFTPKTGNETMANNDIFSVMIPTGVQRMEFSEYNSMPNVNANDPYSELWFRKRNETGEYTYFQVREAKFSGLTTRANLVYPGEYIGLGEYHYKIINGFPVVVFNGLESLSYTVVGIRLEGGQIGTIRAIRLNGSSISDSDLKIAYSFAAYLKILDGYNYAGLQPMAEQGIQQGPIIDELTFATVSPAVVQVNLTYHDPDGDASSVFFNVTQSFGGTFTSTGGILTDGFKDTGVSGSTGITYDCSSTRDTINIVEIYLQDDLRNVGKSRFIRVSCTNGEAGAIEVSADEAQRPLKEQLGAPPGITSNTPPEILNVTFDTAPFTPAIGINITYKDLEGDANTIKLKMIDSDGPIYQPVEDQLLSTYTAQSAGTAIGQRFIACSVSGTFTLEIIITDAQNNNSAPLYVSLDCNSTAPSGSVVNKDSIPTVELPVGAPILSNIAFEPSYYEDVQALVMTISFGDAEGDTNKAIFTVLEGGTVTFPDFTDAIYTPLELQKRASGKYKFDWRCSKETAFSNTIQVTFMDAQGNQSNPAVFLVNCEMPENDPPAGTLISIGEKEINNQVVPTTDSEVESTATLSLPVSATATPEAPTATSVPSKPVDPNCPSLSPRLIVGQTGQSIIDGTGPTNVRPNPGVGQPIGEIQEGQSFIVIGEAVCGIARNGDRMRYFKIQTDSGLEGWVPEANDERYFMEHS